MTTHLDEIQSRIVKTALTCLNKPLKAISFSGQTAADELLNDLDNYPHAFVFACLLDVQSRASEVWLTPNRLKERLGFFDFAQLTQISEETLSTVMSNPSPLHRWPNKMAKRLYLAIRRIETIYGGNASRIWAGNPPSAALVRRFLEFEGIGQKIATMAANILVRDFRIPVSDRYSIDISVDVHVRRVFSRLGFVSQDSDEIIIYTARERYPNYPGIFDLALWELGHNICRPKPKCSSCYLADLCPYVQSIK